MSERCNGKPSLITPEGTSVVIPVNFRTWLFCEEFFSTIAECAGSKTAPADAIMLRVDVCDRVQDVLVLPTIEACLYARIGCVHTCMCE